MSRKSVSLSLFSQPHVTSPAREVTSEMFWVTPTILFVTPTILFTRAIMQVWLLSMMYDANIHVTKTGVCRDFERIFALNFLESHC